MSKEAEMKDAEQTNEEKKDCANKELSKAELEKLTLEGMSVVLSTRQCEVLNKFIKCAAMNKSDLTQV